MRRYDGLKFVKKKILKIKSNFDLAKLMTSYKPVPDFQRGTVGHTAVTNMEKRLHDFDHYSSYTFYSICFIIMLNNRAPCIMFTKRMKVNIFMLFVFRYFFKIYF